MDFDWVSFMSFIVVLISGLNNYLSKRIEENTARIHCETEKEGARERLIIRNTGKSSAKELNFICLTGDVDFIDKNEIFPFRELHPNQPLILEYCSYGCDSRTMDLSFTWDDKNKKGNKLIITLII